MSGEYRDAANGLKPLNHCRQHRIVEEVELQVRGRRAQPERVEAVKSFLLRHGRRGSCQLVDWIYFKKGALSLGAVGSHFHGTQWPGRGGNRLTEEGKIVQQEQRCCKWYRQQQSVF